MSYRRLTEVDEDSPLTEDHDGSNENIKEFECHMPDMQSPALQCCMCMVGVFMFLGGLIMFATGLCLILNYDIFDDSVLSPEMRTEDGKRTVGIILTICGLLAIFVSVLVSVLYLCHRPKPHTVNPDDLSRIPSSARNGTPDSGGARRKTSDHKLNQLPEGMHIQHRNPPGRANVRSSSSNTVSGSTEVKLNRPYKKRHRHKQKGLTRPRLEEIKEADAISRKTVEGAALVGDDTIRSFASDTTLDSTRNHPKIVLNQEYRPPSVESGSISATSDTSNFRPLEHDKSRRELQFIPDAKGRDSLTGYDTSSKDSLLDDNSLVVAYTSALENKNKDSRENIVHNTLEDRDSATGSDESNRRGSSGTNSQVLPDSGVNESDGNASLSSYTAQQETSSDAKFNRVNSPVGGGIVNASYVPDDSDINLPGQSDATSEEDEITPAQTWRSDETGKDTVEYQR